MAFDECPPSAEDRAYLEASLARTTRWLHRCVKAWSRERSSLFGIVQGGLHADLRTRHAEEVCAVDLPGYALGGYSVGEAPEAMHAGVAYSAPLLPRDKPRYLMGVGTPRGPGHLRGAAGVDMFDCVLPTRCARNGLLFTSEGKLVIRNAAYAQDPSAGGPGVRLLHLPHLQPRLPAPPLRGQGDPGDAPQHPAQPALLPRAHGGRARGPSPRTGSPPSPATSARAPGPRKAERTRQAAERAAGLPGVPAFTCSHGPPSLRGPLSDGFLGQCGGAAHSEPSLNRRGSLWLRAF